MLKDSPPPRKFRVSRQINNASMIISVLITNIVTCHTHLICQSGCCSGLCLRVSGGDFLFLSQPVLAAWHPKAPRTVHDLVFKFSQTLEQSHPRTLPRSCQEVTQRNPVCTLSFPPAQLQYKMQGAFYSVTVDTESRGERNPTFLCLKEIQEIAVG